MAKNDVISERCQRVVGLTQPLPKSAPKPFAAVAEDDAADDAEDDEADEEDDEEDDAEEDKDDEEDVERQGTRLNLVARAGTRAGRLQQRLVSAAANAAKSNQQAAMAGQPEVFETPDVPILPSAYEPVWANTGVYTNSRCDG